MGNQISELFSSFFTKNQKMTMIGFDGAGKTTLLNFIKGQETLNTIPTIGFNVETVKICGSII